MIESILFIKNNAKHDYSQIIDYSNYHILYKRTKNLHNRYEKNNCSRQLN